MKQILVKVLAMVWAKVKEWILKGLAWIIQRKKMVAKRILLFAVAPFVLFLAFGMTAEYLTGLYWNGRLFKSYPEGKIYYKYCPDIENRSHEVYNFTMVFYPSLGSNAYKETERRASGNDQMSEWIVFEVEYSPRKNYIRLPLFNVVYSSPDGEFTGNRILKAFPLNSQEMVDRMLPKEFGRDFPRTIEQSYLFKFFKLIN